MKHAETIQNAQRQIEKIALDIDLNKVEVREGLRQIKALNHMISSLQLVAV